MGQRRIAEWLKRYRSVLRKRDLRLLFGGMGVSVFGSWAYNVALLAFVFDRTHSLGWVGAAVLVRFVPPLALSVYGGVIAERTERIRLIVQAGLLCTVWQAAMAAVAAADAPVVLALAFSALTAATSVVFRPAVAATVPSIVDEDELVAANALFSSIEQLVIIVGPAAGALLLVVGSPEAVFAVNAASFAIAAMLAARVRARSRPVDVTDEGRAGPLKQMAVGVRTIAALPAARTLVAFNVLMAFVYGTDAVLFVGVSVNRLGIGPQGFGYLVAGCGVGGIAMALTADHLAASDRLAPIILAGVAGFCLPTALLAVIHSPALAVVIQIVRGASTLIVHVMAVTALQRSVPSDQLARVFGVFAAFMTGAIALGTLITPVLVSAIGLSGTLLTMAFLPVALGLFGYRPLQTIDRDSAAQAREFAPRVALLEQLDMFAGASRSILERLAGAETDVEFAPGDVIVREGEPADALYVLAGGQVEVTAHGEADESERVVRTMTAPAYFGEIGVLERIPRTATVTALVPSRCERIEGSALLEALTESHPSTALMENARTRLEVTHPSRAMSFPET